jgi:hypothetical protein
MSTATAPSVSTNEPGQSSEASSIENSDDLVSSNSLPDEEVDKELDSLRSDLEFLPFKIDGQQDIGVLAYHALSSVEDLTKEPHQLFEKTVAAIKEVRDRKVTLLKKRIADNAVRLDDFRNQVHTGDTQLAAQETQLAQCQTQLASAEADGSRERLLIIADMARRFRETDDTPRANPTEVSVERVVSPNNTNTGTIPGLPSSEKEARIAYLWNRILPYRKDYDEARAMTRALESHGISFFGARLLVWSGLSILFGAGGAIGALLQESDIGDHLLERLLAAIQTRLAFAPVSAGTPTTGWSVLQGIGIGWLMIGVFFLLSLGLLWIITSARKKLAIDDDGETGEYRLGSAKSTLSPWSIGIFKAIFEGETAILRLLPGFAICAMGLLLILAVGPNFQSNPPSVAFSVTKTSVGVVFAIAVAMIAQLLFTFSIFPIIRQRLLNNESLALITPRKAVLFFVFFVGAAAAVIALGPMISGLSAVANGPRPKLPTHIVWFVASTALLLSCCVLSLGNVFRGIYLRSKWVETHLMRLEIQLADKLKVRSESSDKEDSRPETSALNETVGAPIDHKWRVDLDSDTILKRILLSGVFSPEEIRPLVDCQTKTESLANSFRMAQERLAVLREAKTELTRNIWARERSTSNYENRIARVEQQAAGLLLIVEHRYLQVVRLRSEGYGVAQAAYGTRKESV